MKYDVAHRRIWLKGEILDVNDAKVNVLSPTSQFGLNVFEGILVIGMKKPINFMPSV